MCSCWLVFPEALTVLCYTAIVWYLPPLLYSCDTPIAAGKEDGPVRLCHFLYAHKLIHT